MDFGFPEITDSFLNGQDILYTQFNDIEFYVEDIDQEYFYFHTLKKVFPNMTFSKIFPLNGKTNVKSAAHANVGNKKKVFIVDLDFDHILNCKEESENLFYLDRYSIENYLIEELALFELIKEYKPKLRDHEIARKFNYNLTLIQCQKGLSELTCLFLVIQYRSLGIEYFRLNPARDFNFSTDDVAIRGNELPDYFTLINTKLKKLNKRYSVSGHIRKFKKHFNTVDSSLKHIPGKYILSFIKFSLEKKQLIQQIPFDSFTVRLAKNCEFKKLLFLRDEVLAYIK